MPQSPPNGASNSQADVPAAPYPPVISSRYPSAQIRSSMSTTPHYSSSLGDRAASVGSAPSIKSSGAAADAQNKRQSVAGMPTGGDVGSKATTMASSAKHSPGYTSQVRFCQTDLVACINCAPPRQRYDPITAGQTAPTSVSVTAKKKGPTLLELRSLQYKDRGPSSWFHYPAAGISGDVVTSYYQDVDRSSQDTGIFTTRPIALSRGNPSLGTSVSSTCLDVSSISFSGGCYRPAPCATGLTTGALCIHTFSDGNEDETLVMEDGTITRAIFSSSIEYFHIPRNHRQASAVAWRRQNSRHVAIGLVSSTGSNPIVAPGVGTRRGAPGPGRGASGGGDREFCCFLWDIEHQSSGSGPATSSSVAKRTHTAPLFKLSHNAGVMSLGWLYEGGQTLAVGGQWRTIQLYDLRVSGTSNATPPISAFAHNYGGVHVEVDPFSNQLATFSRVAGEPVKIWDARRMDSVMSEIKLSGSGVAASEPSSASSAMHHQEQQTSSTRTANSSTPVVSAIRWSPREAGMLSIALGDAVHDYDTRSAGSRPILSRISRAKGSILDLVLHPSNVHSNQKDASVPTVSAPSGHSSEALDAQMINELGPHRMIAVLSDRSVVDMPKHQLAPLAISPRNGAVVHTWGSRMFVGSTFDGPSAMECSEPRADEDISATMMRRARCLHVNKYSMDAAANIKMLVGEIPPEGRNVEREILLRLWTWIHRIEMLFTSITAEDIVDEGAAFFSRGLASSCFSSVGVWNLLQMGLQGDQSSLEDVHISDSLGCNTFDSPLRRAAFTACGWVGNQIIDVSRGEYERSAALAVFHGNLGAAVDVLQRGADAIYSHMNDNTQPEILASAPQYAETLQLVAMCIAGYGGVDSKSSASSVWRRACSSLLQRPDMNRGDMRSNRTGYLRALCIFLMNVSTDRGFDDVLNDNYLSLCDRVAFACKFLDLSLLKTFLQRSIVACQAAGDIEGLVITGIDKDGVKILQSYVDKTADVQTAALVSSRVIFQSDWTTERRVCAEFLESYRSILNQWQLWQSRAMFDVDRADLLRKIKVRQAEANPTMKQSMAFQSRRVPSIRGRGVASDILTSVPAQLDARCTYCSSPLGLKRLDNHANQWLSKMKPVLSCCPTCQKPLPRCAICLLSLGCLNPYTELTKERERSRPSSRGGVSLQPPDDLASLSTLPFAEWFSWCMRCKHGGHAHHLVGWFANHTLCPVSGCDCRCQFDGIQKLTRPALTKNNENAREAHAGSSVATA